MFPRIKSVIPSILTLSSLVAGFAAMLINDPLHSLVLIIAGCFLDIFDGIVARALHVSGEFGKQVDSLADLVTFGVAPAFLVYQWLLPHNLMAGLMISLLPVFSAVRLARFNTDDAQKYSFKGLPTPANGLFFASLPLVHLNRLTSFSFSPVTISILVIFFAMLMIAPVRMFSFKKIGSKGINRIIPILFILLIVLMSFRLKWLTIPVGVLLYILMSLVYTFLANPEQKNSNNEIHQTI